MNWDELPKCPHGMSGGEYYGWCDECNERIKQMSNLTKQMGPLDSNTPLEEKEMELLTSCYSYPEFRAACDTIKARRKMSYPPDWWEKMMKSGLYEEILSRFS